MTERRGRRWALTGPTGAGKSELAAWLAARGAAVVDADRLGHEVLRRPEIAAAIGREFGAGVLSGGEVDRAALGAVVFADPAALRRLEALTHPQLARLARERLESLSRGGGALAVLEAAVYFLLPPVGAIDLVVCVRAERARRRQRLLAAGLRPEEADRRLAAQAHLAPHWGRADIVLHNDGSRQDLGAAAARLLLPRWPGRDGGRDPAPEEAGP